MRAVLINRVSQSNNAMLLIDALVKNLKELDGADGEEAKRLSVLVKRAGQAAARRARSRKDVCVPRWLI